MSTKARLSNKAWLVILIVFALVIQFLFDPLTDAIIVGKKIQAHAGFPAARARWDAQHINHYQYDVNMFTHNSPCIWQANLEVKNGVVIAARDRSDWPQDLSTLDAPVFRVYEPEPDTPFLCNYHNFTMPKLFNTFEQWLEKSPSLYEVSYNKEYGFISGARFGPPSSRGWLRSKTWHCCNGFTIANFEVLDD